MFQQSATYAGNMSENALGKEHELSKIPIVRGTINQHNTNHQRWRVQTTKRSTEKQRRVQEW